MSNQIRLIAIGVVTALMCGVIQAKQESHAGAFAAQTQPLSPSVLATILLRGQSLELAVLWGATPGWFLEGSHRSANGGAAEGRFTATLDYGGRQFGFSYEPTQRSLLVQGKNVSLPNGVNVVMVDLSNQNAASVTGTATVNARIDGNPSLASLFGQSPQVVSFLRCDAGTPDASLNRKLIELLCADLPK